MVHTLQKQLYNMNTHKVIIPVVLLFAATACKKTTTTPTSSVDCSTITYSETIKPLFDANCLACHGSSSSDGALSNYAETMVYVENGKLKDEVVTSKDMPIGSTFSSDQIAQVECWLDAGAPNN